MNQLCVHSNDSEYRLKSITKSFSQAHTVNHATKPNSSALGGHVWADTEIYWKRDSSYPWIGDLTLDAMIKSACLEGSVLTPLKIRQRNRKMSDAQIVINFLGKKDEPYFKSASTLAFGYGPAKGLGGNVTMNADVLWLLRDTPLYAKEAKELGYIQNYSHPTNKIKFYDPLHTMKHELGHALGMKHIEGVAHKETAVMYPYYNGLRSFGSADITYLTDLYGKAGVATIIKNQIVSKINSFK